MLDHRLQILLNEDRYDKLAREAGRRGVSIAAVIRDAIDRLPVDDERRRAAVSRILAAEPMEVPLDPAEIRRELDTAHDRIAG
jgi:hypothetical protein